MKNKRAESVARPYIMCGEHVQAKSGPQYCKKNIFHTSKKQEERINTLSRAWKTIKYSEFAKKNAHKIL